MITAKKGHIVTIASILGLNGCPKQTSYSASKFAAVGLADSLRIELNSTGKSFIKTTLVCPWMFDSGMFNGCQPG